MTKILNPEELFNLLIMTIEDAIVRKDKKSLSDALPVFTKTLLNHPLTSAVIIHGENKELAHTLWVSLIREMSKNNSSVSVVSEVSDLQELAAGMLLCGTSVSVQAMLQGRISDADWGVFHGTWES